MKTIYCVEDDSGIRELVVYALRSAGYESFGFADAEAFYPALEQSVPALALLDIMLPGEDGLAILRQIRQCPRTESLPVILLTARSTEYDKVMGLDLGADDYISKPFGVMELLSRVKAVLRRTLPTNETADSDLLTLGPITLLIGAHRVTVEGNEISLTNKEFELLAFLMRNHGIVLTRDQLLDAVWQYGFEGESRTVDVHIGLLRQKLGSCGRRIQTVRGVGYRMEDSK